jgi:hypothetical protein
MSTVREAIEREAYTIAWNSCHHEGGGLQHACGDCRHDALTRIAKLAAGEALRHPQALNRLFPSAVIVAKVLGEEDAG